MDSELDQLGERIAEQAAHLDAAMHQLLVDLHEFDERGGWAMQGALSCAHWLAWRVGWTLATARDRVRVARKLPEVPTISDALRRGEVSYSKVRAMIRIATAANERLLLDYARFMTASQLEETCRKYALVLRHGQDPHPLGDLQRRYVRRRDTDDGMVKIEALLHPEEAELIWTMLNHAATQLTRTPEVPTPDSADTPAPTPVSVSVDASADTQAPTPVSASIYASADTQASTSERSSVDVSAETQAPTSERSSVDVSAETQAPIPVSASVDASAETQASIPVSASVDASADTQAPTPVSASVDVSADTQAPTPVSASVDVSADTQAPTPVSASIDVSAEAQAPTLVFASVDASADTQAPTHESASIDVSAETQASTPAPASVDVSAETQAPLPVSASVDASAETQASTPAPESVDVSADTQTPALVSASPSKDGSSNRGECQGGRSLLDRLLDDADMLRAAQATPGGSQERDAAEHPRRSQGGVLHQRADAVRRSFNRADALVAVAQRYLRGDRPDRAPIEVTLTVAASSLCSGVLQREGVHPIEVGELGESFVSCEAARRLSCDSGVVEVVEDDNGVPLSVGRKRRTISGRLKRALRERDKTCSYPGCTNYLFLEGHHIRHWADGGETSLNNACLLCTMHHHYVHEYRYTIELDADQRPRFRDPHGRLVVAVPDRPVVADLGWPTIRAANESLRITAETNACKWDGNPIDYGAVIGYLVAADGLS